VRPARRRRRKKRRRTRRRKRRLNIEERKSQSTRRRRNVPEVAAVIAIERAEIAVGEKTDLPNERGVEGERDEAGIEVEEGGRRVTAKKSVNQEGKKRKEGVKNLLNQKDHLQPVERLPIGDHTNPPPTTSESGCWLARGTPGQ